MRILLVEDNRDLSDWLCRLLRRGHYVIDSMYDGESAAAALATQIYSLVILDLALPRVGGLTLLRDFRDRGGETPVLILTADDGLSSRVAGLNAGADDYLAKPFEVAELEARMRALLRRGAGSRRPLLELGPLSFDSNERSFVLGGTPLALTPREHAVLETLLRNANRTTAKDRLAESVFGLNDEANPNAVEVYVHRVRKKLEGGGVSIATLRGLGYMLRVGGAV